jgi:hypothetical protein
MKHSLAQMQSRLSGQDGVVGQGRLIARLPHKKGFSKPSVLTRSALVDREDAEAAAKSANPSVGYERSLLLQGVQSSNTYTTSGIMGHSGIGEWAWSRKSSPYGSAFPRVSARVVAFG